MAYFVLVDSCRSYLTERAEYIEDSYPQFEELMLAYLARVYNQDLEVLPHHREVWTTIHNPKVDHKVAGMINMWKTTALNRMRQMVTACSMSFPL